MCKTTRCKLFYFTLINFNSVIVAVLHNSLVVSAQNLISILHFLYPSCLSLIASYVDFCYS